MPHAGHCVDIHCRMHAGQIPPVSNVFHKCPQLHAQRAFASGDQAHNGQRMRGPANRPWHRPRLHRRPGPPRQASDHYAAGGSACSGDNLNPDVCTSVLSSTQMHSSLFQINTRTTMRQLRDEMGLAGTLDDISDEFLDRLQEKRFDWVWLLGVWRTGDAGRQISRCNETWQTEFRELIPDIQEPDICGSCLRSQATRWMKRSAVSRLSGGSESDC